MREANGLKGGVLVVADLYGGNKGLMREGVQPPTLLGDNGQLIFSMRSTHEQVHYDRLDWVKMSTSL